jgi:molybdopterin-guanine dinucleotide biosynthesis protein A
MTDGGHSIVCSASIAGVILAGGLSRRMGGVDKPLAVLNGTPMIGHVIARLRPQVSALAINANGDPARFAEFGLPVLPDPIAGFIGPLAGLLAALQWAKQSDTPHVVTAPADTPFLPENLVKRLYDFIDTAEIAVARFRGEAHPTIALWSVSLADDLSHWLRDGTDRAVHVWIGTRRAVAVDFTDDENRDPFFNVNAPADLEQAEARVRASSLQGPRQ